MPVLEFTKQTRMTQSSERRVLLPAPTPSVRGGIVNMVVVPAEAPPLPLLFFRVEEEEEDEGAALAGSFPEKKGCALRRALFSARFLFAAVSPPSSAELPS